MAQEKIIEIPLKSLVVDYAWNSRTGVDKLTLAKKEGELPPGETGETEENEFHGLVASLKSVGQDTPIDVIEKGGKFFVVTGFRRTRALTLLAEEAGNKDATIKAVVKNLSPYEARILNIRENTARQRLTAPDTARALVTARDLALKEKKEFTQEQLAAALGIGKAYASKLFKIQDQVTPKVLKQWHEGQVVVGVNQMEAIAKLGPEKAKEQEEKFTAVARPAGSSTKKHWTEGAKKEAARIGLFLGKCVRLELIEVKRGLFQNHLDKLVKMGVGEKAPTDKQKAEIISVAVEAFKKAQEEPEEPEADESDGASEEAAAN